MLAIIPARGGSKRIPKKNIKLFLGKPMISYAIETARSSGIFDEIFVSTDSEEIADIARAHGAHVPRLRARELSDDHTPTVPVIRSTLELFYAQMDSEELVCCIYPCTPLLDASNLVKAAAILRDPETINNYALPVVEFPSAPQRALLVRPDGSVGPEHPEYTLQRTQDLQPLFYDAGQFYFGSKFCWLTNDDLHVGSHPIFIPKKSAIDIDTAEDWELAEIQYQITRCGRES